MSVAFLHFTKMLLKWATLVNASAYQHIVYYGRPME